MVIFWHIFPQLNHFHAYKKVVLKQQNSSIVPSIITYADMGLKRKFMLGICSDFTAEK